MNSDDVERLRRGYAAFNEGGVDAVINWLAPEIEVSDRQSGPDRETRHGIAGIVQLFVSNMEAFDRLQFEPEEFIDAGEHILVVLRQRAHGRGSGIEVEGRVVHLWTMHAGRPIRLKIYGEKKQALEAVQLEARTRPDPQVTDSAA
jgi:ketosteroid isomerase-like protein